ncbi:MAG: hypothetical protein ACI9W2_000590, partial [Gammaproteobacteria bacterium]
MFRIRASNALASRNWSHCQAVIWTTPGAHGWLEIDAQVPKI